MTMNEMLWGNYTNRKFRNIFPNYESFENTYLSDCPELLPKNFKPDQNNHYPDIKLTYILLLSYYGNSTVANDDENQFKFKLFSTIFRYGPTWKMRTDIQDKLRAINLDDDSWREGGFNILNTSVNPSTQPANNSEQILETINQQNTSRYKKGKLAAYGELYALLKTDVVGEYIDKFKKLFLQVVEPQLPLWYVTNLTNTEEDDNDLE